MQKVKLIEDYLNDKKGDTINVTERHASILIRTKIAEKENVAKGKKEDKEPTATKEDKGETKTKSK